MIKEHPEVTCQPQINTFPTRLLLTDSESLYCLGIHILSFQMHSSQTQLTAPKMTTESWRLFEWHLLHTCIPLLDFQKTDIMI